MYLSKQVFVSTMNKVYFLIEPTKFTNEINICYAVLCCCYVVTYDVLWINAMVLSVVSLLWCYLDKWNYYFSFIVWEFSEFKVIFESIYFFVFTFHHSIFLLFTFYCQFLFLFYIVFLLRQIYFVLSIAFQFLVFLFYIFIFNSIVIIQFANYKRRVEIVFQDFIKLLI